MNDIKTVKDLLPDSHNANKGTQRGLKMIEGSLQEDGFGRPVLVDKNGKLIAGNKTIESVAQTFGIDTEVVLVKTSGNKVIVHQREDLDLDDLKGSARRLAYRDNLSSHFSFELDPAVVLADFEGGFDFGSIGLQTTDLTELLPDVTEFGANDNAGADTKPEITQTEAEKYQEIWQVKPDSVWQLGRHKIACVNSLDMNIISAIIGSVILGMVWADPPYGINIVSANVSVGGGEAYDIPFGGIKKRGDVGGGASHIRKTGMTYLESNKRKGLGSTYGAKPFGTDGTANLVDVGKYAPVAGDSSIETAEKSATMLLDLYPNAVHFWWGGNYYTNVLPPSPCWVIWDKDNTGNFADCEMAWSNHNGAARIFEHRWNGMLKASEHGQRRVHPTQKPVALFKWCVEKYLKGGGVVFDPFLGSGISIIGAEELGENYTVIGCELAPEYIATTIQRWVNLTGKTPVLIEQQ